MSHLIFWETNMTDLSNLFDVVKDRILLLEQNIVQSVANHNVLLGQHGELKLLLDNLTKDVNAVAPDSLAAEILDVVDEVVPS